MRQIKYMNLCGQFHDKIHSAGRWSQIYHVDALNPLSLHWSLPRPNCQKKLLPRWKLRRWSTMGINFSQHLLRNYITWINSLLLTYLLGKLVGCGWQVCLLEMLWLQVVRGLRALASIRRGVRRGKVVASLDLPCRMDGRLGHLSNDQHVPGARGFSSTPPFWDMEIVVVWKLPKLSKNNQH